MLITQTADTPEMTEEFAKYNLRNFAHDHSFCCLLRIYDSLHSMFSKQRVILISKVASLAGEKMVQCSITSRLLVTTLAPVTDDSHPITRATGG